jgi:hypothetical protein
VVASYALFEKGIAILGYHKKYYLRLYDKLTHRCLIGLSKDFERSFIGGQDFKLPLLAVFETY